uniref:diguanylate cyclase n=1 Tax=Aliivibrio wodanis TaxID=80852 RepID=A0A5Q4ZVY8_9GAMM|nr:Diguanylate cyclase VdcA [Aliivibrio wodanis]
MVCDYCSISQTLSSLPEPSFLLDINGRYIQIWGGKDRKLHHNLQRMVGLTNYDIFDEELANRFMVVIQEVSRTKVPQTIEYSINPSDVYLLSDTDGPNELQYFSSFITPFNDEGKVLWSVRNITELKLNLIKLEEQAEQLEKLTNLDHLTQVYNRYALELQLPNALLIAKQDYASVALFMIDIDYFKQLNDCYGHVYGDQALVAVSQCLKTIIGNKGKCFRYGGDEFLLFITHSSLEEIKQIANEIQNGIAELLLENSRSPLKGKLTITIGIEYKERVEMHWTLEDLVQFADKALFTAKSNNRNTIKLNIH